MIFCKFLTAKFMFSKLTKIQPVRKRVILRTGCIFGQFCKLKVVVSLAKIKFQFSVPTLNLLVLSQLFYK